MILSNRRLRLLYVSLAGMDIAVLLPWLSLLLIFWARNGNPQAVRLVAILTQSPLLIFILLWATVQGYMLLADLLNRWQISGGAHALTMIGVLAITSLLAVRILLYPELPLLDFGWLRETIFALINLAAGVRGEILIILINYVLWLRVARYTDRSLTFFGVGLSFRLGMLLIVAGTAILSGRSGETSAALLYLLLFFAFGLCAVALARIDQKAVGSANSSGALLPWDRFAQLWLVIVTVLAGALAISTVYTPQALRAVLSWFAPVGQLLQWVLTGIAFALFFLLAPIFEWLAARIQAMMADAPPMQLGEEVPPPDPFMLDDAVQEFAMLRYCVVAAIIFGALLIFLIYFVRMSKRERPNDPEDVATEGGLRPGSINLGLDRLKNWFALLGRYGLGSQLLAAISVENIYANLARLARRKGFPRPPAFGPDRYLPILMQAFPDHERELQAITAAYTRVRYAERPITQAELEDLRAAYTAITTAPEGNAGSRATT